MLMASLSRAFSYLIAAQVQAVGLIFLAYWGGNWLNTNYPMGFNWYIVTFILGVLGVAQTFYVVIKAALDSAKPRGDAKPDGKGEGAP